MSTITTTQTANDEKLFLVYYAIDSSLNLNGWRVTPDSIEKNIRSFVGKPIVLKYKNPFDENDRIQIGQFVHPILRNASLTENLNYQQQFAVGRINDVSLNPEKGGWRFDVEITDPEMKQAFKSNTFYNRYPRRVSPQIATFPDRFPYEADNVEHWYGLHLALVDVPAYGFAKADVAGECYGSEQICHAELRSAGRSASTTSASAITSASASRTQAMLDKIQTERAKFFLSIYAPEFEQDRSMDREVRTLSNLMQSGLTEDNELIDYLEFKKYKASQMSKQKRRFF